mmetsp:Transcript_7344/g.22216  ORF Transcript_7344/g.22216 Transcript_7344/m.22216 type:complete len:203 (+) Transcript_7344:1399-2007(+)
MFFFRMARNTSSRNRLIILALAYEKKKTFQKSSSPFTVPAKRNRSTFARNFLLSSFSTTAPMAPAMKCGMATLNGSRTSNETKPNAIHFHSGRANRRRRAKASDDDFDDNFFPRRRRRRDGASIGHRAPKAFLSMSPQSSVVSASSRQRRIRAGTMIRFIKEHHHFGGGGGVLPPRRAAAAVFCRLVHRRRHHRLSRDDQRR